MNVRGQNLIAGEWSTAKGNPFHAHNPMTGKPLDPPFTEASAPDVTRAAAQAEQAAAALRHATVDQMTGLLVGIADGLTALGDALIQRAKDETGLPTARLEGERTRTTGQLKLFADVVRDGSWVDARIDRANLDRKPLPKPDLRRMLIPIGPVAVFAASNFPFAFSVAGGDTASALAARCPVIVKAHPAHPGTSEMMAAVVAEALRAYALPAGAFSMLHGVAHTVGQALVRHPAISAVAFTGSLAGGRGLFDIAAARPVPIPVYAEMGSINPIFILPQALEDRCDQIASGLAQSVTLGAGQFCTKPGMVVGIQGSAFDGLVERTRTHLSATGPHFLLYHNLKSQYEKGLARMRSIPGLGALVPADAQPDPSTQVNGSLWRGNASVILKSPGARQELFGPSTVFVACKSIDEMLAVARMMEGQLTGTIHGTPDDLRAATPLIEAVSQRCGRVIFNGYPTGVEVASAMQHGGPYPASTDPRATSVGTAAIHRFARPISYQNAADELLPAELQNANPRRIERMVDGKRTDAAL